ncbi:MAG: hypothetical protein ACRYG6_02935 [Janthinobacterium lividum]
MQGREILRAAAISGTAASASSTLALALLARSRGLFPAQPANATSHWLHGDRAARVRSADLSHTAVGLLTHGAATLFWATIFEGWLGRRRVATLPMLQHAMALAAVAAAVDYVATPHRFTPGWELVLPKRDMAAAYVAMALGLAAGSLAARRPAAGRHPR